MEVQMKLVKITVAVAGLALLIGAGCTPKSKPENVSEINRIYKQAKNGRFGTTGRGLRFLPYRKGHFVRTVTVDGDKRSVSTITVADKQGDTVALLIESLTPAARGESLLYVKGLDKARRMQDASQVEIVKIRIRDEEGEVNELSGMQLKLMSSLYRKQLPINSVQGQIRYSGAVTVPAGRFASTMRVKSKVRVLGSVYTATGYYHTAVPINGMVKSISEDTVVELLDFGYNRSVKLF